MTTSFINSFNALAKAIHETAREKGWYHNSDAFFLRDLSDSTSIRINKARLLSMAEKMEGRNDGEMIALMHSELSEALEAIRNGNPPDDKIPAFSGAEAELADVIIRIMDMSYARGWRVGEAIIAKMEMNKGRAYKHGGKAF